MLLKMHGFKNGGLERLFTTYVQMALPLCVLSFFFFFLNITLTNRKHLKEILNNYAT